jgi:hypothetical protein
MPIFTYVVVVSLGLIALLFIMDVTLEKGAPPIVQLTLGPHCGFTILTSPLENFCTSE